MRAYTCVRAEGECERGCVVSISSMAEALAEASRHDFERIVGPRLLPLVRHRKDLLAHESEHVIDVKVGCVDVLEQGRSERAIGAAAVFGGLVWRARERNVGTSRLHLGHAIKR